MALNAQSATLCFSTTSKLTFGKADYDAVGDVIPLWRECVDVVGHCLELDPDFQRIRANNCGCWKGRSGEQSGMSDSRCLAWEVLAIATAAAGDRCCDPVSLPDQADLM
jgi:hypothetical protein